MKKRSSTCCEPKKRSSTYCEPKCEKVWKAGQALERAQESLKSAKYWLERVVENKHGTKEIRRQAQAQLLHLTVEFNKYPCPQCFRSTVICNCISSCSCGIDPMGDHHKNRHSKDEQTLRYCELCEQSFWIKRIEPPFDTNPIFDWDLAAGGE